LREMINCVNLEKIHRETGEIHRETGEINRETGEIHRRR
jgi:hypothetical protein